MSNAQADPPPDPPPPHDPKTCPNCRTPLAKALAQADQAKMQMREEAPGLLRMVSFLGTTRMLALQQELYADFDAAMGVEKALVASAAERGEKATTKTAGLVEAVANRVRCELAIFGNYALFTHMLDKIEATNCQTQEDADHAE